MTSVEYISLLLLKTSQQGGLSDTVEIIAKIAGVVLLVGGVLWGAYRIWIKDREHRPRLEPGITGTLTVDDSNIFLTWKASLKNVGTSKVDVEQRGSALRVYSAKAATGAVGAQIAQWDRQITIPVSERHAWIESSETIEDSNSLNIARDEILSLKLDLRIVSEGTEWNHTEVIAVPSRSGEENANAASNN